VTFTKEPQAVEGDGDRGAHVGEYGEPEGDDPKGARRMKTPLTRREAVTF
jgi:hypothetical protein